MKLRPHHLLDIISDCGHDVEFKPDPYGHALHRVARAVLSNIDLKGQFVIGADDVCRPCKHLQSNGRCDDILSHLTPPMSKQEYNDDLDSRLFAYLGLSPGMTMTIRRFLESVNEKVPGIEGVCSHPEEDPKARLDGLIQGLTKLGIRRK